MNNFIGLIIQAVSSSSWAVHVGNWFWKLLFFLYLCKCHIFFPILSLNRFWEVIFKQNAFFLKLTQLLYLRPLMLHAPTKKCPCLCVFSKFELPSFSFLFSLSLFFLKSTFTAPWDSQSEKDKTEKSMQLLCEIFNSWILVFFSSCECFQGAIQ